MNCRWRRGILFAGVHFAVATTLTISNESTGPKLLGREVSKAPASLKMVVLQEGGEIRFDPCGPGVIIDYFTTPEERTIEAANLPLFAVSGWSQPCPPRWSLAGRIHARWKSDIEYADKVVLVAFISLIPTLWFLVGAFPIAKPRRRAAEPGAFITLCTLVAAPLAFLGRFAHTGRLFETLDLLPQLVMVCADVMWLFWFGLLLWRIVSALWHFGRRMLPHSI
jgi:hypothetical protein